MHRSLYLQAWGMLVVLGLLAGWAFMVRLDAVLLLVVFVLWAAMLCWQVPACWWLLVFAHGYGTVTCLDHVLVAREYALIPCALVLAAGLVALLADPPTRWHKRHLPGEAQPALSPREKQRRDDFLNWWATQPANHRQRVWMRLLPEERAWALQDMPADARTVYRQIERAEGRM